MAAIKPIDQISKKWVGNSSQAGTAYRDGVTAPRTPWAASAAAADDRRKAGLAAADARNAFVAGVNKAGDSKWQQNSITLGPSRFATGVQNAQPAYQSGFAKYHQVISATTLPPRGPKGSPENINRVTAITSALHQAKQQG